MPPPPPPLEPFPLHLHSSPSHIPLPTHSREVAAGGARVQHGQLQSLVGSDDEHGPRRGRLVVEARLVRVDHAQFPGQLALFVRDDWERERSRAEAVVRTDVLDPRPAERRGVVQWVDCTAGSTAGTVGCTAIRLGRAESTTALAVGTAETAVPQYSCHFQVGQPIARRLVVSSLAPASLANSQIL